MARTAKLALAMLIALDAATLRASAQENLLAQVNSPRSQLINRNNLVPTGETVPHPGQSQIGSETAQEKAAHRRSQKDTHSICSNCE